jgi:hypothetical protein
MTLILNGTTGINSPGGDVSVSQGLSGNLTFTGAGQRITWNMSPAAIADRVFFQTSVTNGASDLNIMPNGTGFASNFTAFSSSDPANSSLMRVGVSTSTGVCFLNSFKLGTGTTLPITFQVDSTERMRIDSSGRLLIGGTSSTSITGETFKQLIFSSGTSGVGVSQTASGGYCYVAGAVSNGGVFYFNLFAAGASAVGSITSNGTSTTYGTTSDYRLKENVAPMQNALATVAALKPCTYTWKADGSDGQGFIAHELQAVVPDCVTGTKDAVDKDGNPQYQGVDTSFLVATLVAAIQELKNEVDALKGAQNV